MTDEQLQTLVEQISLEFFHQPFQHKAWFNKRLKTTGGRYQLQSHNIDINPKMYTAFDEVNLIGVVKHELVHYHLHLRGLPYQHKDQQFKVLLANVGGSRFAPQVPSDDSARKLQLVVEYQCQNCGQTYARKRHIDTKKYVCGKCKGHLVEIGSKRV
ncbi:SprT family protein [Periweissella cryptocerci]|uniref:SprT family protein n=1 Tax=Periweissella cryptocerci TaxID=2506420 RepID=A0A4P6YUU2_9LACO|nr:SprT family protein [Periweissella cryptocerci]QBO36483.1 SprT family protein [Periweissella cryptocerci]